MKPNQPPLPIFDSEAPEPAAPVVSTDLIDGKVNYQEPELRISEAAKEQGHGPQERGTPLPDEDRPVRTPQAKMAQRTHTARTLARIGHRETRFTDVGPHDPVETAVYPEPHPDTLKQAGHLALKKGLEAINNKHIKDLAAELGGGDPERVANIAAALRQKHNKEDE